MVRFGDLPSWLEAAGTVGALGFLTREAIAARRRGEAAQADRIALEAHGKTVTNPTTNPNDWIYSSVVAMNRSELPVTNIRFGRERPGHSWGYATVPILMPGEAHGIALQPDQIVTSQSDLSEYSIDFTDGHGRRWRRTLAGSLYRV